MKNFLTFIFIPALSFLSLPSTLSEIKVSHDIEAITVYLNSAEITRKAEVSIPAGKSDLIFKGISSRILDQGMKIKLSEGVKVYAVNIEENKNIFEEDGAWLVKEKESKALKEEKMLLEIERSTLEKERDYFIANMKIGGNNGASYTQLDEGAKYFREKIKGLEVQLSAIKDLIKELDDKQFKERGTIEQLSKDVKKRSSIIRITVISDVATTCDVDLRYLVSNAIWKPYYSIRAKGENEPITLEYQAQIYNDTGNDWDNKPITLAILDPSEDVSKPAMDAWVLDNYGYYGNEGKLSDARGKYDRSDGKNVGSDVLQIDDLSTRFEIEDKHLIPSDATPHLIDVTSYTRNAEFYTLSIPKVKDGAFLVARIPQWESLGLLDGPMNLYYNDAYQGVSQLSTQQISDTLDVSLGKENSYTITRRKISSMSSEKLIGFNIKEVLTYEIIVKNNKNQAAEIEVRDQLPVSTDKNVEVKPLKISGAEVDQLSGQLTWKLQLAPNESKKISLKFSVRYPKSKRGLLKHNKKKIASPRFF